MKYIAEIQLVACVDIPQLGVIKTCVGKVCKEHTECNGEQQQRLELFDYAKVQEHKGNKYHYHILPAKNGKT